MKVQGTNKREHTTIDFYHPILGETHTVPKPGEDRVDNEFKIQPQLAGVLAERHDIYHKHTMTSRLMTNLLKVRPCMVSARK